MAATKKRKVVTKLRITESPDGFYVEQLPERTHLMPDDVRGFADARLAEVLDWRGDAARLQLSFRNGVAIYNLLRKRDDYGDQWFSALLESWELTI